MTAGLVLTHGPIVSYGAAVLFGVAICRALAQLGVARARAAGFEMLWTESSRGILAHRGKHVELALELRNRDALPLRFLDLRVTHAHSLIVEVLPNQGEIPAHGRLTVRLRVLPERVGYHGIHGLTLRAVRAPGLFTVPLSFASPVVLEVLPAQLQTEPSRWRASPSVPHTPDARHGILRGEGSEFRELREHRPGDPFQRIAWKPSARRGRLLVTEKQQEQRDSAWFVIDASLESAAGAPGEAPLDRAIDDVARLIARHVARGDRVGLSLVGARELVRVPLGRGARQHAVLLRALAHHSHTADADRSEWDDQDVKSRVLDHLRSLDVSAQWIGANDTPRLLDLAQNVAARAPVRPDQPWSTVPEDRFFRQYLLSFGVQPPPRGSFDRVRAERELARVVRAIAFARPRPSVIYLFARAPAFDTPPELLDTLAAAARHRVTIDFHPLVELPEAKPGASERTVLIRDALRARLEVASRGAARELRRRGVRFRANRS